MSRLGTHVLTALNEAADVVQYQLRRWTRPGDERVADRPEHYHHTWQALIDDIDILTARLDRLRRDAHTEQTRLGTAAVANNWREHAACYPEKRGTGAPDATA